MPVTPLLAVAPFEDVATTIGAVTLNVDGATDSTAGVIVKSPST